ncbi:histone-lysine N-methyltransferase SETMAR [Trichonephila clavipes]|nr:histone-lysine N-methyltransferase SETMAR [Trichonephila clavipes]
MLTGVPNREIQLGNTARAIVSADISRIGMTSVHIADRSRKLFTLKHSKISIYSILVSPVTLIIHLVTATILFRVFGELQGVKNGSRQRKNSVHFFFDKGEKAAEIVNDVYGDDSVTHKLITCNFVFADSVEAFFDVKVAPRTGRPVIENVDKITEIIEVDWHVSSHSITQELATDQKRKELANRRGVVFHQDNATPHTCVVTRRKLWELDWEVLMHPPYSPDLVPNNYHLLLAFQNFLSDKKLGSRADCENRLLEFLANNGQDLYEKGNMKLPLKWQQIIQQNGTYLTLIGQSETC